jgi:hypothetical protein
MMDQVANGSLEIVLVIQMGGDTQTHVFANPNEIPGIVVWITWK